MIARFSAKDEGASRMTSISVTLWRVRLNRWAARLEAPTLGDPEGYGETPDEALRNLADMGTEDLAGLTQLVSLSDRPSVQKDDQ